MTKNNYPTVTETTNVIRIEKGKRSIQKNIVEMAVCEFPLALYLNGQKIHETTCSPDNLCELAAGILHGKGIIEDPRDIKEIDIDTPNHLIKITIYKCIQPRHLKNLDSSLPALHPEHHLFHQLTPPPKTSSLPDMEKEKLCLFTFDEILHFVNEFERHSTLFQRTGGAHGAALFNHNGTQAFFTDISRHNALEKLLGYCFLNNISTSNKLLMVSCRVPHAIAARAIRSGIRIIASPSAPSDLAIKLAKKQKITLIGFVREDRVSIYSHPERIQI